MDYNDVLAFARVVERGSFTAAAAALGVPKSSVSRGVTRLEKDLGVRLLQRTTRRLALTDLGQHFFERARGAIAGLDEAALAAREFGAEPRGTVRATAPADAFALGVGEAVALFVARYPAIHVDLMLTSRIVDLVGEGLDLAVRVGRLSDSTLIARKVGSTDAMLFASPAYLERRGRPKTLAALTKHDCVLFRARGARATWRLTGPEGETQVSVTGPVSADDWPLLARVAAAGAGIALLPVIPVHDVVQRGDLKAILTDYRSTGAALHVVLPSSVFVPSRVALLRDFLVECLGKKIAEAERRCTGHA